MAAKRQIASLICSKCGQDSIEPSELHSHGIGKCSRVASREKRCPLCGFDFHDVKTGKKTITDWQKSKPSPDNPEGQIVRETREVFIDKRWSSKKIYAHKIEHRRKGDTPEMFT